MITIVGQEDQAGRVLSQVEGLTLRDVFAGLAMAGTLANETQDYQFGCNKDRARFAYAQADAMLEARKEHP